MEKDLFETLVMEEKKYMPLLMDELEKSPLYPKLENGLERLYEELMLLRKTFNTKAIWICYLLAKEAKKHNEPYIVRGGLGNLYILYVLEIIKFNPIGTNCCYQACLGTFDSEDKKIIIDFSFRKGFVKHMKQFALSLDETTDKYHYSYSYGKEVIEYSSSSIILIPKNVDLDKNFLIYDKESSSLPIVAEKTKDAFDVGVMINILGSNFLSLYNELNKRCGEVSFSTSFDDYKEAIFDEQFTSHFFIKLLTKYKVECLDDAFKVEGMCLSKYKVEDLSLINFGDRETIFYYFHNFLRRDEEIAYTFMENTRKGRFQKEKAEDVSENLSAELGNILYLPHRGMVVQTTYYRILLAYYFKNFNKDYVEVLLDKRHQIY